VRRLSWRDAAAAIHRSSGSSTPRTWERHPPQDTRARFTEDTEKEGADAWF
jgi:hypothetical protein